MEMVTIIIMVQAIIVMQTSSIVLQYPCAQRNTKNSHPHGEGWGETWGSSLSHGGGWGEHGGSSPEKCPTSGAKYTQIWSNPHQCPLRPRGGIIDRCITVPWHWSDWACLHHRLSACIVHDVDQPLLGALRLHGLCLLPCITSALSRCFHWTLAVVFL